MITHVVLFKFKDRSAPDLEKARDVLLGMEGKVPVLRHLEVAKYIMAAKESAMAVDFESK